MMPRPNRRKVVTERAVRLPIRWRDRLPDPATYYAAHVASLGRATADGWARGCCPFHEDRNASLSVHVGDARGGWRCFTGCGHGDLVAFHCRLHGLDFIAAVRDLIGSGR
ncbi:CHC2 zinc finger domain-containing protein [Lysobacter sp. CA199]|uniref:CHC2 zinc finger domain-containing protein n=1 Tax=Lysobacter sp. CA199 TaxID=3455608 RepID=UPI003F8D738D